MQTPFRPLRRPAQTLDAAACQAILRQGTHGVLALSGEDGWPYAVPLNYWWDGARVWFHCATEGGKLAALRRSPKASFCVVGRAEILPERFATAYRSVIVFGELREVTEPAAARAAIEGLTAHLAPRAPVEAIRAEIARGWGRLRMLALTPTRVSGKWGGLPPED